MERSNDGTSYIHGRRRGHKDRSFPSEPDVVETFLSVWSHCVILIIAPLVHNPNTKRLLVLLVLEWHPVMAMVLFKLYQPFILLLPELVVWFEAHVIFPSESDFVQSSLSIKTKCVLLMPPPLRSNPKPK